MCRLYFFISFGSAEDGTQGSMDARQAACHYATSQSLAFLKTIYWSQRDSFGGEDAVIKPDDLGSVSGTQVMGGESSVSRPLTSTGML